MEEVLAKQYSLRQLKKMAVKKKFEESVEERRKRKKEKKLVKKQERLQQGLAGNTKTKATLMKNSTNKMAIAIDLSFNELMGEKEIRKLNKQIQRCYAANRRNRTPCQFYLTSCSQEFRDTLESQQPGASNWDIHYHYESYLDVFKDHLEKGTLIFLSPCSQNTLPDVDALQQTNGQYAYVIGGLVDHNHHKGLTKNLADEKGVKHAKLPLDDYVSLSCSKVLTVNHGELRCG